MLDILFSPGLCPRSLKRWLSGDLTAKQNPCTSAHSRFGNAGWSEDHPYIARTLAYLAVTLARLGEIRRATELSVRALRIWEVAGSADTAGFADSLMMGATIQERRQDWATARRSFQRALDIRMPMFGPNHPAVAEARAGLAATLAVLGDTPEAALEAMQSEEESAAPICG